MTKQATNNDPLDAVEFLLNEVIAKNHKCTICEESFPTAAELQDHKNRDKISGHQRSLKCHLCGDEFRNCGDLQDHITRHSGVYYTCGKCNIVIRCKEMLKIHIFGCRKQKLRKNKQPLRTKAKTSKLYRTSSRKNTKNSKSNGEVKEIQKRNILQSPPDNLISCRYCNGKRGTKEEIKVHVEEFHRGLPFDVTDGAVSCTICKNIFASLKELTEHVLMDHLISKPIICEFCGLSFVSKSKQTVHLKETHNINRYSKSDCGIICKVCEKVFISYRGYKEHIKNYSIDKMLMNINKSTDV